MLAFMQMGNEIRESLPGFKKENERDNYQNEVLADQIKFLDNIKHNQGSGNKKEKQPGKEYQICNLLKPDS